MVRLRSVKSIAEVRMTRVPIAKEWAMCSSIVEQTLCVAPHPTGTEMLLLG